MRKRDRLRDFVPRLDLELLARKTQVGMEEIEEEETKEDSDNFSDLTRSKTRKASSENRPPFFPMPSNITLKNKEPPSRLNANQSRFCCARASRRKKTSTCKYTAIIIGQRSLLPRSKFTRSGLFRVAECLNQDERGRARERGNLAGSAKKIDIQHVPMRVTRLAHNFTNDRSIQDFF